MAELYFLCASVHPEIHPAGSQGSLATVKVSDDEFPAYLAFRTPEQALGSSKDCSPNMGTQA
jgi:hypothetical protein